MFLTRQAVILMALVLALAAIYLPQYAKPQNITITTYGATSAAITAASVNLKPVGAGTGFYNNGANGFSFSFGPTAAGGCQFTINIDQGKPLHHTWGLPCIKIPDEEVLLAFSRLPKELLDALRIALKIVLSIGG